MLQKVPTARLAILPAASNIGISGETAVLVPMVSAYLDDVPPATARRNVLPRQPLHCILDHLVVDRLNRADQCCTPYGSRIRHQDEKNASAMLMRILQGRS
jgi:hypothetical protein